MIVIVGCIMVVGAVYGRVPLGRGDTSAALRSSPPNSSSSAAAALGALVVMSSKKTIIDLMRGILQCLKGTPYNKRAYDELFKVLYDLFRTARRDGLIALESAPQRTARIARSSPSIRSSPPTATPWISPAERCRRSWKGR